MSRSIFHCSHSDSSPSAACTETDDEDDSPAKFSSDSESEDAQPSTKPLTVEGYWSVSGTATERLQLHTDIEGSQSAVLESFEH